MLPKDKINFLKYTNAIRKETDDTESASELTFAILKKWQAIKFPALNGSLDAKDIKLESIDIFLSWIVSHDFLEAAFWLSSLYSILSGNDYRSKNSLYFTPPQLADRLISNLLEQGGSLLKHSWHDPAAGGAAFLAPVAIKMAKYLEENGFDSYAIIEHISQNLSGNDIDTSLVEISEQFLKMSLYKHIIKADQLPNSTFTKGNALKETSIKHDIVICNPPYRKLVRKEIDDYKKDFKEIIEGQFNIYGLFIEHSLRQTKDHGMVGMLTPTSYISSKIFSKLRASILNSSRIQRIDLISDRTGTFIGVQQETAISIISKKTNSNEKPDTQVFIKKKNDEFSFVANCRLNKDGKPWLLARSADDAILLKNSAQLQHRFSDYGYYVRVGSYVDFRDKRAVIYDTPKIKENHYFPIIWPSSIKKGKMINLTVGMSKKQPCFIKEDNESHPSIIKTPFVAIQRITSPDQAIRLIPSYWDSKLSKKYGGVVIENHVVFLERKIDKGFSPKEIVKILETIEIDRLFRCISGSVSVSAYEINEIPLPPPEELRKLLDSGKSVDKAISSFYKNDDEKYQLELSME